MTTRLVVVPSTEGDSGTLYFNAPNDMGKTEIEIVVKGAIAQANDDNGQRSDEVIEALEKSGFTFLGNPNTECVIVTAAWV